MLFFQDRRAEIAGLDAPGHASGDPRMNSRIWIRKSCSCRLTCTAQRFEEADAIVDGWPLHGNYPSAFAASAIGTQCFSEWRYTTQTPPSFLPRY